MTTRYPNATDAIIHSFDNGNTINIPADPYRIYGDAWANGAAIMVSYLPAAPTGLDPSDRIILTIYDAHNKTAQYHLNVEDATAIISGLIRAIKIAIDENHPLKPIP